MKQIPWLGAAVLLSLISLSFFLGCAGGAIGVSVGNDYPGYGPGYPYYGHYYHDDHYRHSGPEDHGDHGPH